MTPGQPGGAGGRGGRAIPEDVRRRNLALVLDLLHREGNLSRATLTERTGLNRSTVADLVAALADAGLVTQIAPGPSHRVGRPSPIVAIAENVLAIAANPEVDALEIAAVGLDRTIRARVRIPHRLVPTAAEVTELLADRLARWGTRELAGTRLVGVGIAVPGLVRAADGVVREAPHLRWRDVPLADLVAAATGLPTAIGNDASLGARAEHLFGAARGIADVVYVNGGASGIGGGIIVAGVPVNGAGGYAGEFGQSRPHVGAVEDRRSVDGALEDEVSRARLLAAAGVTDVDDAGLRLALAGSEAPQLHAEVERQRRILATSLSTAVNVLNPSAIVLGGFLAALADLDPSRLAELVRAGSMPPSVEGLVIRSAELADDRLLIGAAEAAFAPLLADPLGTRA